MLDRDPFNRPAVSVRRTAVTVMLTTIAIVLTAGRAGAQTSGSDPEPGDPVLRLWQAAARSGVAPSDAEVLAAYQAAADQAAARVREARSGGDAGRLAEARRRQAEADAALERVRERQRATGAVDAIASRIQELAERDDALARFQEGLRQATADLARQARELAEAAAWRRAQAAGLRRPGQPGEPEDAFIAQLRDEAAALDAQATRAVADLLDEVRADGVAIDRARQDLLDQRTVVDTSVGETAAAAREQLQRQAERLAQLVAERDRDWRELNGLLEGADLSDQARRAVLGADRDQDALAREAELWAAMARREAERAGHEAGATPEDAAWMAAAARQDADDLLELSRGITTRAARSTDPDQQLRLDGALGQVGDQQERSEQQARAWAASHTARALDQRLEETGARVQAVLDAYDAARAAGAPEDPVLEHLRKAGAEAIEAQRQWPGREEFPEVLTRYLDSLEPYLVEGEEKAGLGSGEAGEKSAEQPPAPEKGADPRADLGFWTRDAEPGEAEADDPEPGQALGTTGSPLDPDGQLVDDGGGGVGAAVTVAGTWPGLRCDGLWEPAWCEAEKLLDLPERDDGLVKDIEGGAQLEDPDPGFEGPDTPGLHEPSIPLLDLPEEPIDTDGIEGPVKPLPDPCLLDIEGRGCGAGRTLPPAATLLFTAGDQSRTTAPVATGLGVITLPPATAPAKDLSIEAALGQPWNNDAELGVLLWAESPAEPVPVAPAAQVGGAPGKQASAAAQEPAAPPTRPDLQVEPDQGVENEAPSACEQRSGPC
jgi:hypothetical protein